MKKSLLFKKMIIVVLLVGLSSAGWAQILYGGFNYATPAFIGGNTDVAGVTSNNWATHSVTAGQTTTINIEDASLTYAGLASSTGNKVLLFSNKNVLVHNKKSINPIASQPIVWNIVLNGLNS